MQVNMHEAKSQLSKLGELALQGENIIIAKAGKPLFRLIPYEPQQQIRTPGRYAGFIKYEKGWDSSEDELIDLFEGNNS